MSRVYWHTPSGEAELQGSELHHMHGLCADIAVGQLGLDSQLGEDKWRPLVNPAHHIATLTFKLGGWRQSFETSFRVSSGTPLLLWKGKPLTPRTLIGNTALAVGNDAVKLAARLAGQREIHAWVDGPNRAWLADIIQAGLDCGVLRAQLRFKDGPYPDSPELVRPQGWEGVMELLRTRDDEPVVTSYSVGDSFPSPQVAGWELPEGADPMPSWLDRADWDAMGHDERDEYRGERADELWEELAEERQWELAMAGLAVRPGLLELTPENWDSFHFRHGLSVLDLTAHDRDARLDAASLDPVSEDDEL